MVREDIVAGLRNSVERGESLEKAKQSFISAGYPRQEVEEAASLIHSGSVLLIEREGNFPPLKIQHSPAQPEQIQPTQQVEIPKEDKPISTKLRRNFKIILLLIVLLVLVGILIVTLVFRDKIVALFS